MFCMVVIVGCCDRQMTSDRSMSHKRRSQPLEVESLRMLTSGKHIWHGLLLVACFEAVSERVYRHHSL